MTPSHSEIPRGPIQRPFQTGKSEGKTAADAESVNIADSKSFANRLAVPECFADAKRC
jgi:hypothetical protein